MSKITVCEGKTLKLTNVLIHKIDLQSLNAEMNILEKSVEQMQNYIKVKAANVVGPLIQHTKTVINDNGEIEIELNLMLQCNVFLHNVEPPFSMKSLVRVPNCMYCRYVGPESKIKFAYDKIQLTAFEEDIPLKGDNYTIFVNRSEDEIITADVFMERAD